MPFQLGDPCPHSKHGSLGTGTAVRLSANGISISSSVYAGLTVIINKHTHTRIHTHRERERETGRPRYIATPVANSRHALTHSVSPDRIFQDLLLLLVVVVYFPFVRESLWYLRIRALRQSSFASSQALIESKAFTSLAVNYEAPLSLRHSSLLRHCGTAQLCRTSCRPTTNPH